MLKTAIIVTAYKTIISKFVFVSNVHFDREDRICFRFVGFSLLALSKKKKNGKSYQGRTSVRLNIPRVTKIGRGSRVGLTPKRDPH